MNVKANPELPEGTGRKVAWGKADGYTCAPGSGDNALQVDRH